MPMASASRHDDEFAVTMRLAKGGTKLRMRMLNNNDGTVLLLYSEHRSTPEVPGRRAMTNVWIFPLGH